MSTTTQIQSELEQTIRRLLADEMNEPLAERRSIKRRPFMRPVFLQFGRDERMLAFSKNISALGVGLVHAKPCAERRVATLTFQLLDDTEVSFRAVSRWCQKFGSHWHLSGWQLIGLQPRNR